MDKSEGVLEVPRTFSFLDQVKLPVAGMGLTTGLKLSEGTQHSCVGRVMKGGVTRPRAISSESVQPAALEMINSNVPSLLGKYRIWLLNTESFNVPLSYVFHLYR